MTKALGMVFPVNRCHQRVVTFDLPEGIQVQRVAKFPVNRCHQRVVTLVSDM